MDKALSQQVEDLQRLFRTYVGSHQRPSIDACRELVVKLGDMAHAAYRLEQRAADAEAMEAVAQDLDIAASAALSPSLQQALKTQQSEIQRELDAGGPVHVARPGLAGLSSRIGDSNVFTFPKTAADLGRFDCAGRHIPGRDGGGDAA